MTFFSLCEQLHFPQEAVKKIAAADAQYDHEALAPVWRKLYDPKTWDAAVKELQGIFAEDEDGMKMLTCMLHCCLYTRELYEERGIPEDIFLATMSFLIRFLERQKEIAGEYVFVWAWWFPRQLALREFRIGELEYEMTEEGGVPCLSVHIPAGVSLTKEKLGATHRAWKAFAAKFFPAYENAEVYCDSWMLSPALRELLPANSNILYFQSCFEILHSDDNDAVLDWVFPGEKPPYEQLSERTSLQRAMKRYLVNGGRVGWIKGRLRSFG